jgi:AraC family transcriptional regulator of adaptative response/methylated-DNA-[protein]-cysteine methyltransferase
VAQRDQQWDGVFIVAVATTGIACRPVCPSRPARPENLEFFATLDDAVAAGFRPCLRCKPDIQPTIPEFWTAAIALTDSQGGSRLTDAVLSNHGIDPVQLRRYALRTHGMTFHGWLRGRRITAAQRRLRQGARLDQVIVESSWHSHSGFRDAFTRLAGATPGRARHQEPIAVATWQSPVGPLLAAAVDEGICMLEFSSPERIESQANRLTRWFGGPVLTEEHRHLTTLFGELTEYFAGRRRQFAVPLAIRGTPFEQATWQALREIPYGETCSYADVAAAIANPHAVRAVGSANGRNRIAIVIPCHRVVNADGRMGGYGGGLWRKKRLLDLEQRYK